MRAISLVRHGWLAAVPLIAGCAAHLPVNPPEVIARHAVFINQPGRPLLLRTDGPPGRLPKLRRKAMTPEEYDASLDAIVAGVRNDPSHRKHVLIRIHGGLNGLGNSISSTDSLIDALRNTNDYPIAINWESSWWKSYCDHLLWVRHGHRYNGWGIFGVPAVLVTDVGRGVVRAPVTTYRTLLYSVKDHASPRVATPKTAQLFDAYRAEGASGPRPRDALAFDPGFYEESGLRRFGQTVYSSLFIPAHVVAAVIVDAFGTSAWDNMLRTTETMFRADGEFNGADVAENRYRPASGAVARLMKKLAAGLPRSEGYNVTLIGHSMGAIVAGEMLQATVTSPEDSLPVDTVVFMAAASSVRQFSEQVVPYLQAHRKARFYNLTLHPISDLREPGPFHLTQGSLLEWIDDFLSTPSTEFDRVIGKRDNVVCTSHAVPRDVRAQVAFKSFDYFTGSGDHRGLIQKKPRKHGDFSDLRLEYWRTPFWSPRRPDPWLRPHLSEKDSIQAAQRARAPRTAE